MSDVYAMQGCTVLILTKLFSIFKKSVHSIEGIYHGDSGTAYGSFSGAEPQLNTSGPGTWLLKKKIILNFLLCLVKFSLSEEVFYLRR